MKSEFTAAASSVVSPTGATLNFVYAVQGHGALGGTKYLYLFNG